MVPNEKAMQAKLEIKKVLIRRWTKPSPSVE
jgi:hypothetical protein